MKQSTVAYFSAEYAIADALPTYAGGLGVLAGDTVRQAGTDGRDFVALGPAYRQNVAVKTEHRIPLERQMRHYGFELVEGRDGKPLVTSIDFVTWQVKVRAWERKFGTARLLLLDTDFEPNTAINRKLMSNLYDPDLRTRLLQQFLLAAAGETMMRELGIKPDVYHLNEGHMAFVLLVLALEYSREHPEAKLAAALEAVGPRVVATKHTILPGAGDFTDLATLEDLFGPMLQANGFAAKELFEAGQMSEQPETFSTTRMLLATARAANAVSEMHRKAEKVAHPHSRLIAVTNGVYAPRWQEQDVANRPEKCSDDELWRLHCANRTELVQSINDEVGTRLEPDRLTVVWARRFAAYKRPTLLLSDAERLTRILMNADFPVQIIISGNANESDVEGLQALEAITSAVQRKEFDGRLVYLPHYVTATTKRLAAGADVWLNTPVRGMEACGTSGMKASLNGALQFSTSDGWFDEIKGEEIGWVLPEKDPETALYDTLEMRIAPLFYNRDGGLPTGWLRKMRAAIETMERQFTAHRMLEDYYEKMYRVRVGV